MPDLLNDLLNKPDGSGKLPTDEYGVFHIKPLGFPYMEFEWHPTTKKFYHIDKSPEAIRRHGKYYGEMVAQGIESTDAAYRAAAVWLKGYRYATDKERLIMRGGAPVEVPIQFGV